MHEATGTPPPSLKVFEIIITHYFSGSSAEGRPFRSIDLIPGILESFIASLLWVMDGM